MNADMDANVQLANGRSTGRQGVQLTGISITSQKFLLVQESPETMHNAAFHPGLGASAVKGTFVVHNGHVQFGFADGHIEALKKQKVLEMLQGRNNLVSFYFDPFYR
jgi:prepilin-type processing-associated H-X9-DG protein